MTARDLHRFNRNVRIQYLKSLGTPDQTIAESLGITRKAIHAILRGQITGQVKESARMMLEYEQAKVLDEAKL